MSLRHIHMKSMRVRTVHIWEFWAQARSTPPSNICETCWLTGGQAGCGGWSGVEWSEVKCSVAIVERSAAVSCGVRTWNAWTFTVRRPARLHGSSAARFFLHHSATVIRGPQGCLRTPTWLDTNTILQRYLFTYPARLHMQSYVIFIDRM